MRRKDREVTDKKEIQRILETCKVCRIGLPEEDGVYIVPMNHGYCFEEEKLVLYFHGSREGKKMEMVRTNPAVGIEMDCDHELVEGRLACQHSYHFSSIVGKGKAREITEPEEKLLALGLIMKHQTGKDFDEFQTNPRLEKAVAVIRVDVEDFDCKRYV